MEPTVRLLAEVGTIAQPTHSLNAPANPARFTPSNILQHGWERPGSEPENQFQPGAIDPERSFALCHSTIDDAKSVEILDRYTGGDRDFRDLDLDDRVYDFSNSGVRYAIFAGSFILASFRNAHLEGADFSTGNVKTCDFSEEKLIDARFCGPRGMRLTSTRPT